MDNSEGKSSSGRSTKDALAALHDVIVSQQTKEQAHEPTPTEYFALLATTISVGLGKERLPDFLRILIGVIPNASITLQRSQFKVLSQSLLNIAKAHFEDATTLNLTLAALGTYLQHQETSDGFWGSVVSLQCVNALIKFIDDERHKIRKTAQDQLTALMIVHLKGKCNAVRSYICDFCAQVIKACTRNEYKRSLFLIIFLESSLVAVPEDSILNLFDSALKLQVCQIPKMTAAVYRMFDSFYQNPHFSLSAETTLKSIKVLIQHRPDTADMESNTYYCTALASAFTTLHKQNRALSHTALVKVLNCLVIVCDSEFTQVHCAVGTALKRIISGFVDKTFIANVSGSSAASVSVAGGAVVDEKVLLGKMLSTLEVLFQLKYQHAWLYILDSVRSLFEAFKGNQSASILLTSTVQVIARLYQAIETSVLQVSPSIHIALGDTLGVVLRSIGVVAFLREIPLIPKHNDVDTAGRSGTGGHSNETNMGFEASREWILNILHNNLKLMACSLSDFASAILPIASVCRKASENSELNAIQSKLTRNRVLQLWSLLPEMCAYHCLDIVASFPKLSPIMLNIFQNDSFPELVPYVVNALTFLANGVRERCPNPSVAKTAEFSTLQAHSELFVRVILHYMEGLDIGDGRFQEGLRCVTAWVTIAAKNTVLEVAKHQLTVILTPTASGSGEDGQAASSMAIIMSIIPQLPKKITNVLYEAVSPMLDSDNVSLQKRAYCILNELLTSHSEIVYSHKTALALVHQVHDSLLTCHVSSRNMRFRCLVSLLTSMTDMAELKQASDLILGEVLICQKDANKKSRDAALDILRIIIAKLEPTDILMQLCSALVGETTIMRSSAVTCMCMLMLENRDNGELLGVCVQLLPTVCLLLQEESADQTKAALSYIRVCTAVLKQDMLFAQLESIVKSFTSDLGNQKSKFSSRCRAIMRKLHNRVGELVLREVVPESDLPLLEYICKQNRRALRRKEKKQRGNKLDKMLGSDSDDSSSDEEDVDEMEVDDNKRGSTEDYRLTSRPKAIRAKDTLQLAGHIPTSLDDLLEDQPAAAFGLSATHSTARGNDKKHEKRGANGKPKVNTTAAAALPEDEDEEYSVAVTADGKVVVKERPLEIASTKKSETALVVEEPIHAAERHPAESAPNKKRKLNLKEPGEEYRSKKAGGDVWKKGMLEPHAYIPLDARLFSKKNHTEAVSHFGVVVKGGKKTQKQKNENLKGRSSGRRGKH